jgi:hypothetical protein
MATVQPQDRIREAKIFLASRIAEEAERQGLPLHEIERKMLYYAERGWTLPDMEDVNDAIAQQLDQRAYEKRIGLLIRSLRAQLRATGGDEYESWNNAIAELKLARDENNEQHYLLTLIAKAQPEGEIARLVVTALVVIGVMLLAIYLATGGYG